MAEKKQAAVEDFRAAVTDALLAAANAGPAVLTNRFVVSVGPFGVRIAFMEQTKDADTAVFRTAVVMSHADGILLSKLLGNLLKELEAAFETAKGGSEDG